MAKNMTNSLFSNKKAGLHQNHSATTPTHKRIVCFYYV